MSKKNLAKTAVEGGRGNRNKWERRNSHTQERCAARDYCQKMIVNPELAEEEEIKPKQKIYKEFNDKLSPVYRYLKSKVGLPWAETKSEIFKKFDSRTTVGRHILFDHLLSLVVDTKSGFNKYGRILDPQIETMEEKSKTYYFGRLLEEYYVDQQGLLQKVVRDQYESITEAEYREAGVWLNGNMVINRGGKLFWCCPMEGLWKSSWHDPNGHSVEYNKLKLGYYLFDNGLHKLPHYLSFSWEYENLKYTGKIHSDYWNLIENPFSFRQRGELSEEDVKFFKSFKKRLQEEILEYSSGR